MALFGKADADLPLLTQAFQIDPDNMTEVEHFAERLSRGAQDRVGRLSEQQRETMLRDLAGLCRLTRAILSTLHDEGGISVRERRELEEFLGRFRVALAGPGIHLLRDSRTGDRLIIPIEHIKESIVYEEDELIPVSHLLQYVRALLREVPVGQAALTRCKECESVFVTRRAGQQFCSHRCADRVSARRRRQRKSESDSNRLIAA